jgi:hypothetical protein
MRYEAPTDDCGCRIGPAACGNSPKVRIFSGAPDYARVRRNEMSAPFMAVTDKINAETV